MTVRCFLLVVMAGVVAHIATDLLAYRIDDMWAPDPRGRR